MTSFLSYISKLAWRTFSTITKPLTMPSSRTTFFSRSPASIGLGAVSATATTAGSFDVSSNYISAFRLKDRNDQSSVVLGSPSNFWKWSEAEGFDLTHPLKPDSDPIFPRFKLQCALTPVWLDPSKTALVCIDMQNYNLSRALGNDVKAYNDAEDAIVKHAIPAARKLRLQVIWLTWGLTEQDIVEMDPGVLRTFGWHSVRLDNPPPPPLRPGQGARKDGEKRNQKGVGDELGQILLEDGVREVDGGRILMQGTWNAELHGRLKEAYGQSQFTTRPDKQIHKNRNSGMCDKMTALREYLDEENIRTLLFTGVNVDQCVMGTLQDANLKGFDCILLKDGCGTNSPEFAQLSAEYNCLRSWGFLSSCKDLAGAAAEGSLNFPPLRQR